MQWFKYDRELWHKQKLPIEKRRVLVQVAARETETMGLAPAVAVGYMKYAAGDKHSPHFIVPGVGGPVVAWCDCLGDDFTAPLWPGERQPPNKY